MEPKRQINPTPVRLPDELRAWLHHQAIDNRRSLNGEITIRLEQSRDKQTQGAAQ